MNKYVYTKYKCARVCVLVCSNWECQYKGWVCNAAIIIQSISWWLCWENNGFNALHSNTFIFSTALNIYFDCVSWLLAGKTNCSCDIHAANDMKCIYIRNSHWNEKWRWWRLSISIEFLPILMILCGWNSICFWCEFIVFECCRTMTRCSPGMIGIGRMLCNSKSYNIVLLLPIECNSSNGYSAVALFIYGQIFLLSIFDGR